MNVPPSWYLVVSGDDVVGELSHEVNDAGLIGSGQPRPYLARDRLPQETERSLRHGATSWTLDSRVRHRTAPGENLLRYGELQA